ncbi:hypothetical protein RintRC_2361 [Richelia intracellularis]|nr:hypothetical protein RintRC_2361 [Richelia intracellularis]
MIILFPNNILDESPKYYWEREFLALLNQGMISLNYQRFLNGFKH